MSGTKVSEEFLLEISKILKEQTEEKNGHVLAKSSKRRKFLYKVGRQRVNLKTMYYALQMKEMPSTHCKIRKLFTCTEELCISHVVSVQKKFVGFETMESGDFQYWTNYLSSRSTMEGSCMLWNGTCTNGGYGQAKFGKTTIGAHRFAWQLFNGRTLNSDIVVRHRCPKLNRKCINIAHLDIGTHQDNCDDMKKDGTVLSGENHIHCLITKDLATQIKDSIGQGTRSQRAKRFNVSYDIVSNIDRGLSWRSIRTAEELKEIDERTPVHPPRLDRKTVRCLKRSRNHLTVKQRAEKFGCSERQVVRVDARESYADVATDEDTDDELYKNDEEREENYEQIRKKIRENSLIVTTASGEHWRWKLALNKDGYGKIRFNRRTRFVHVVSWIVFKNLESDELGSDEEGYPLIMRHGCEFKNCCNPACLRGPGTHKDNMNDRKIDNAARKNKKQKTE